MRTKIISTIVDAQISHSRRPSKIYNAIWTLVLLMIFMAGCKKADIKGNMTNTSPAINSFSPLLSSNGLMSASEVQPLGPGAINLRTASDFVLLTKTGITTTGTTAITGDIGTSPIAATAMTGFGLIMAANNQFSSSSLVSGKAYAANYASPTSAKMTAAIGDMGTAFTTANGLVENPIVNLYAGDVSGKVLTPGLYKYSTGVLITNEGVTLSGGPNDTWVFQIAQNLTVNNSAKITLAGGAQAKNIFWVVSGKATLGTYSDFSGIILSKTLVSLNTGATVKGRLLAQTAVTLIANSITQPE